MTGVIEGAHVNGKVKDDGVADIVNDPRVTDNVFCNREVKGGDVDGVSSGVKDAGVDGKL